MPPIPYVVEEITGTTIRVRLPIGKANSRPGGTVSGPSLMALADSAAWLVIVGQIGPVALSVTTSLHIDFLRRPALVDVVAIGTLLKLGKRLAVADVAMYSVGSDDRGGQSPGHLLDPASVGRRRPASDRRSDVGWPLAAGHVPAHCTGGRSVPAS